MTKRAMQRINQQKRDNLHLMRFVKSLKANHITQLNKKQLELAYKIIDEIIPIISERNYRVQRMTNKELYRLYKAQVMLREDVKIGTNKPLSLSCIRKRILTKENIHHSEDCTICPTCRFTKKYREAGQQMPDSFAEKQLAKAQKKWNKKNKKDLNTPLSTADHAKIVGNIPKQWKNKVELAKCHPQHFKDQFKAYRHTKDRLAQELLPGTIMVLQDFTQLMSQSGFKQDLIITILSYDASASDN